MILVALIVAVWVLVTLEGWERPAPSGPPLDRSPGWALRQARARRPVSADTNSADSGILGSGHAPEEVARRQLSTGGQLADDRPIVTCVRRWPDIEGPPPCPTCGHRPAQVYPPIHLRTLADLERPKAEANSAANLKQNKPSDQVGQSDSGPVGRVADVAAEATGYGTDPRQWLRRVRAPMSQPDPMAGRGGTPMSWRWTST